MNSDNVLCGSFGLYPSYVAAILNSVQEIHFYVLCYKHINYTKYILKYIAGKECIFKLLTKHLSKLVREQNFQLSSAWDTVEISFEARLMHGQLPSELIFAQSVLKRLRLSSLANGIVCINKRVTYLYITNEVLTSRQECRYDVFPRDLDKPRSLGNCKFHTRFCDRHLPRSLFTTRILFCGKSTHSGYWKPWCRCKLCVKTGLASLKSLCVNRLASLLNYRAK
jgi:hypothetical protein